MSAIFGIISKNLNPIEPRILHKVRQTLQHRTTDGSGSWQDEGVFFWHGKLYIHPQQLNEKLPLEIDGKVIVADALLFNRDELFRLLSIENRISFSDAQLLLAAYQKWGKECVHYLDGEYVFAIWDKQSKELFLVSDPIGFRPVFYYNSEDCFIFCSEIKGVEAAKNTPHYFNEEHIIECFTRKTPNNQTYNKDVFALCAANSVTLSKGVISIQKYWSPQALGKYRFNKPEDWFEGLQDVMIKAIEKRLNTDMPVGITLSGGLDSSSIACILSTLLAKKNKPLYTFSSVLPPGYKGTEQDEKKYIEIVSSHCPNIIPTYLETSGYGFLDHIEKAFETDECFPNPFYYVDQAILHAAREKKVRSLYTGFGGDFLVSSKGNGMMYALLKENKILQSLKLFVQVSKTENQNLLTLFRSEYLIDTQWYGFIKKLFTTIREGDKNLPKSILKADFSSRYTYLKGKTISNSKAIMLELIKNGRIGRLAGLFNNRNSFYEMQSCDPFFDRDLNNYLAEIPLELFLYKGNRRSLIRYSMQGILPEEIRWRKDKLPYSPDFVQKFKDAGIVMDNMKKTETFSLIFKKYFEETFVEKYAINVQPFTGFSNPAAVKGITIIQAYICYMILQEMGKNYRI